MEGGLTALEGSVKFGDTTIPLLIGMVDGKMDVIEIQNIDSKEWTDVNSKTNF